MGHSLPYTHVNQGTRDRHIYAGQTVARRLGSDDVVILPRQSWTTQVLELTECSSCGGEHESPHQSELGALFLQKEMGSCG